ncbi:NADP-dependent aldehyde dehydrogenase [Stakelama pacifica]|uniref:NADP-dependent aldehyde dehydrogenase n=2 Tax=Stakelama pacifica TaxID=517720 RepID=A0A4R6G0E5_9SPHN|nr:NADP-dependent aldehyde dehydrogenase [Stakelama pacifica]GGO91083.1 2,5-dioxovalerate dehydrogenase [Stakelama pacifica]
MDGSFLIGSKSETANDTFRAMNPATDKALDTDFAISTTDHVAEACKLADAAFDSFRELDPEERAKFLEAVAEEIEATEGLVERAMAESGLPEARLTGERGRTCGQLRLFAKLLRQGRWENVVVDNAMPDRQPLPRADLRQRRIAVGPVAVFGASNFPLAFSVAGGDTASAFAAGCPVVCKGHPAHPGTSVLVGKAIQKAVQKCGLHEGVFSLIQGPANELGQALVEDPRIKAVGFTGSRGGGLALMKLAQSRPEPIPVYAEMSAVNPVLLFPEALKARGEALGKAYVGSLTMGSGQFCTNPGVVLAVDGPDLDAFAQTAADALAEAQPQVMLTSAIHANYDKGVEMLSSQSDVDTLARGAEGSGCNRGRAALFAASGKTFLANPKLAEEVFGAASIIVKCADMAELRQVLDQMEGQLTITFQMDDGDAEAAKAVLPIAERKAGRILANGWPTGVEVSYAMVHGGPFPATSDPRSTSVGTAAIERYLRPVCYQDLPESILPKAVKRGNPLGLPRIVDGEVEA